MRIDVIIATYNRSPLLKEAVESILNARRADNFDFAITVVDNNSSDDTAQVVKELIESASGRVRYLFEPRQGKSFAANAGIQATKGDVVAFADDDQIFESGWLCAICRAFEEGYDYVTGPVCGIWEAESPPWYDIRLQGAISLSEGLEGRIEHDRSAVREGLSGGNGAVRRCAIERVGGFHPELGKTAGNFAMCEDGELSIRLRTSGYRGVYDPQMKVCHRVPRERLSKRYFRRWHIGYGRSIALIHSLHAGEINYWFGIPRFLIRRCIESVPKMIVARLRGDLPGSFQQELNLWFMTGYIAEKLEARSPDAAPSIESLSREAIVDVK